MGEVWRSATAQGVLACPSPWLFDLLPSLLSSALPQASPPQGRDGGGPRGEAQEGSCRFSDTPRAPGWGKALLAFLALVEGLASRRSHCGETGEELVKMGSLSPVGTNKLT